MVLLAKFDSNTTISSNVTCDSGLYEYSLANAFNKLDNYYAEASSNWFTIVTVFK